MDTINSFKSNVFQINGQNFQESALALFRFQYKHNPTYQKYVRFLGKDVSAVKSLEDIPFLPIRFFKDHYISTGTFEPDHIFESSGTSLAAPGKHYIQDIGFYEKISTSIFRHFFGPIQGAIIIGLLPSYLERNNSSLVHMVNHFISNSGHIYSGFYLNQYDRLVEQLESLSKSKQQVFLFGVTFALLELAANFSIEVPNLTVLETGGMKGRGKEMVREELHEILQSAFMQSRISSEYGMTELLSQAYLNDSGYFETPPWMRVMIRDINDPFNYPATGKTGAINIIDLANVHSCAFIETEDLGLITHKGFRVLGRLDNSDMRGCNLLLS